jgi:hypothetical protein
MVSLLKMLKEPCTDLEIIVHGSLIVILKAVFGNYS